MCRTQLLRRPEKTADDILSKTSEDSSNDRRSASENRRKPTDTRLKNRDIYGHVKPLYVWDRRRSRLELSELREWVNERCAARWEIEERDPELLKDRELFSFERDVWDLSGDECGAALGRGGDRRSAGDR